MAIVEFYGVDEGEDVELTDIRYRRLFESAGRKVCAEGDQLPYTRSIAAKTGNDERDIIKMYEGCQSPSLELQELLGIEITVKRVPVIKEEIHTVYCVRKAKRHGINLRRF